VIGDLVWFDANGDGVADAGEPALEGVVVELTIPGADGVIGGGDDVVVSTTTDASGAYSFTGLYDGEYMVAIDPTTVPASMIPTYDLDSGITSPDAIWQGTLVTANGPQLDIDFGYAGTGSIGDRVWIDLNGDGVQDTGEPGLPAVTVELTWPGEDGISGTGDDEILTTVTGADGVYSYPGLPPGDYTVTIPSPPSDLGATFDEDGTPDGTTVVSLADGEVHATSDFGYQGTALLGDTVWYDLNADGVQDPGEPGLEGVAVTVTWLGADGAAGGGDDVTFAPQTTDALGGYGLSGLPAGAYVATATGGVPAGMAPTFDEDAVPDGTASVPVVASGETHDTTDFGYTGTAQVASSIWLDLNGDAVFDTSEPGIPEVDITLVWAGPDGVLGTADDVALTTTTGPDGSFVFPNLPAGDVSITVDTADLPPGVTPTFDIDGGADSTGAITLAADETFVAPVFGYVGSGSVGDLVFYDFDGDGIADPGEPGVGAVTLVVTHFGLDGKPGTADDLVLTTATDAAGNYTVPGLPDGSFSVVLDASTLPPGVAPGSDLDGGDPASTTGALPGGQSLTDVDFGMTGTGAADGVVFDDIDGDGVQGPGEGGVAGVTIVVTWDGPAGPVTTSAVTGADGTWNAPGLPPGDYTITVDETTLPEGFLLTTPESETVTLGPGDAAAVDFGIATAGEIAGVLWLDADGDGIIDIGEVTLPGVVVNLLDGDGTLVASVTTGPDGAYSFPGLTPGTYTVEVNETTLPDGIAPADGAVLAVAVTITGTDPVFTLNFAFHVSGALPFTGLYADQHTRLGMALLLAGGLLLLAGSLRRRRTVSRNLG